MIVTVCRRCTERHVGCHATCERYIEQRAELDRIREQRRKESEIAQVMIDSTTKAADKERRKKNRRWSR